MCGRFTLSKPEKIQKRFKTSNQLPDFDPSYNISPQMMLPVITRNSPNKIIVMRWGLVPHWAKQKDFSLINIRSETAKEKPYFRNLLLTSRCIVPADGFYEWKKALLERKEEKYPYYFYKKDGGLFGFAGLYVMHKGAEKIPQHSFAILTCRPNKAVGKVHNRMPVILGRGDEEGWLDPRNNNFEDVGVLLRPFPDGMLEFHAVSRNVNNPRNEGESLVENIGA